MNDFKPSFMQWLKHFRVGLILMGIAVAVTVIAWVHETNRPSDYYDSPNTQRVYGDQRVFDYADQLTDDEEARLEEYIHETEKKTCMDIVIVTINQPLADYEPEYRSRYDIAVTPDKYTMVYADKFWEDNKFGYDCPQVLDGTTNTGDGILLVDNLYKDPEVAAMFGTSGMSTWMCTTGKAEEHYSSSDIDYALDRFYDYVETDYYEACEAWVRDASIEMRIFDGGYFIISYKAPLLFGLIVALIYFCINASEKAGKVTVDAKTYVDGKVDFPVNRDTFIRKNVTKVYNPPSSSSGGGGSHGGGGHHSSGGGGSHGGGGHSR